MIFKPCSCGIDLTLREWLDLPLAGEARYPGEPVIELRNHSCCSTIAIELPRRPPRAPLPLGRASAGGEP